MITCDIPKRMNAIMNNAIIQAAAAKPANKESVPSKGLEAKDY